MGYEVRQVAAISQGAADERVIELASNKRAILVTEDKDFGELVFAHQMAKVTVVFLRYRLAELPISCPCSSHSHSSPPPNPRRGAFMQDFRKLH